jgi:hypothetical protein
MKGRRSRRPGGCTGLRQRIRSHRHPHPLLRGLPGREGHGRGVTDRDLPFATLRLTQRLRKAAQDIASTLEDIADDGVVDASERGEFDTALTSLKELGETISDIVLYAATQE